MDGFLSLDFQSQVNDLSGSILDTLLGSLEEFLASLLTVDGLAGWGSAILSLLQLLFLLLLVLVGLVESSGQDD